MLPTLLSHVFVAHTIELDNEFEHRMPHFTTNEGWPAGRPPPGPWLTSFVMWENCLRHVGEEGITVRELTRLARTETNLNGMQRWGYVVVTPWPPRKASLIRLTVWGQKANAIWQPLPAEIEGRWRERFGSAAIDRLRASLVAVVSQLGIALPDCLPILGYGLTTTYETTDQEVRDVSQLSLSALLAKLLLSFALEFDRESEVSLAISANFVRVGGDVRLAGVSKEAIAMARKFCIARGYAVAKGKSAYTRLVQRVESRWEERFSKPAMQNLRESLGALIGDLDKGLTPYPDGWRAKVPKPATLPHYPLVLHRGGFPDGS